MLSSGLLKARVSDLGRPHGKVFESEAGGDAYNNRHNYGMRPDTEWYAVQIARQFFSTITVLYCTAFITPRVLHFSAFHEYYYRCKEQEVVNTFYNCYCHC